MKLSTYLERENIDDAAFAERVGISRANMSRLRRQVNGQMPSRDTLAAIVRETGGEVTANDFWQVAA